jgi:hypothetical protein
MITTPSTFYILLRNYNPINEASSPQLKQAFSSYGQDVLDLFKKHFRAKNSNFPVRDMGLFFAELDTSLKSIKEPGIIQGWREYFNAQPQNIKSEFYKKVPNPTFLGKTLPSLNTFSPDNVFSGPVTPFANVKGSQIPTNHVNTGAPLPTYISANLAQASSILGKLNNKNLQSIMEQVSVSTKNHGGNLVADTKHVERMGKVLTSCTKKVLDSVGDAKDFLLKAMNFNPFGVTNNDISAPQVILEQSIEGQKTVLNSVGLDILPKVTTPLKSFASPKKTNSV